MVVFEDAAQEDRGVPKDFDPTTAYVSPLRTLIADLRRKNVAAPPRQLDVVEPWAFSPAGSSEEEPAGKALCQCRRSRYGVGAAPSPSHSSSMDAVSCPACGLQRTVRLPTSRHMSVSAQRDDPRHVHQLLQSTPQLRFICADSMDMNGSGSGVVASLWDTMVVSEHQHESSVPSIHMSYERERANHQAATELASMLWTLSHEMSLEDFGALETQIYSSIFDMVRSNNPDVRIAAVAAMDALLDVPSADEERKSIKFAVTLSKSATYGDFEFLSVVAQALGKMASRVSNADLVESEVTRAMEWLGTNRSDRRLAACLTLRELALHAPTTFHSKTSERTFGEGGSNVLLDLLFESVRDPQPIVRACAVDCMSQCLRILVERQHTSLTGLLCQAHAKLMKGFEEDSSRARPWLAVAQALACQHGSLMAAATMIAQTRDFMLPRFDEVCKAVFGSASSSKALIRLEVVRLIPRLAARSPREFARRYLQQGLVFLVESASTPSAARVKIDIRPTAFSSIGQLLVAMVDAKTGLLIGGNDFPVLQYLQSSEGGGAPRVELCESGLIETHLPEIFELVRRGLRPSRTGQQSSTSVPALFCAANLVEVLRQAALPYVPSLIDDMFASGLSEELIECLHSIGNCVPNEKEDIERRILEEVSEMLAARRHVFDPLRSTRASTLYRRASRNVVRHERRLKPCMFEGHGDSDEGGDEDKVEINLNHDADTIRSLVLCLQTLSSFGSVSGMSRDTLGATVPLLPFLQDVVAKYLQHPAGEVRRAAALTCCGLMIPYGTMGKVDFNSGLIIEDIIASLVASAVSDVASAVRLCVVRALDARYDRFLCQGHHLSELSLLLQDEVISIRADGLRLLGRLASLNPAPILPVMRKYLGELVTELQCSHDAGRGREEATKLLVVFLRCSPLQRLVDPVLATIVNALPLKSDSSPRLASLSLEAIGCLALATGESLVPWVRDIVPHVLAIMQDQSSSTKQETSLRTLGQIAGATGYIVRPYLDFPQLLGQATGVLPAAQRAPWTLRREVIRTLGILGALDPDRYFSVVAKSRKDGAAGSAYFEIEGQDRVDDDTGVTNGPDSRNPSTALRDDLPAFYGMYEQYAMVVEPVSSSPVARRITPVDEHFYPTVSIQALMRIFDDSSLAVHHGMVIQATMYIFKSLGLACVQFLPKVVPRMISAARRGPANLRESLLLHLISLGTLVKQHLRPYVGDAIGLVEEFWGSRHFATILSLLVTISDGVADEFAKYVPTMMQKLLRSLDELHIADWVQAGSRDVGIVSGGVEAEKLILLLQNLCTLRHGLQNYMHILVPCLLDLVDPISNLVFTTDDPVFSEVLLLLFRTVSALMESHLFPSQRRTALYMPSKHSLRSLSIDATLASRVVQPTLRALQERPPRNPALLLTMVETLCVCAKHIGLSSWMHLYDRVVRASIAKWQSDPPTYGSDLPSASYRHDSRAMTTLQFYDESLAELAPSRASSYPRMGLMRRTNTILSSGDYRPSMQEFERALGLEAVHAQDETPGQLTSSTPTRRVNQVSLQRAWDVSQRMSRDDWEEWMRRFTIQLLREAPSPSLQATANLAQAYQPLARELFSAAFACCWKELNEMYRSSLVHALKTAFVADVAPEILQTLLNLAEFMEHDSGGLPIDISVLADLALKCRAYAKALHYKEREYRSGDKHTCVESLISINRKLGLHDAALGVLRASSVGFSAHWLSSDESSTRLGRHQAYEMYYSVVWGTEDGDGDMFIHHEVLASREELWLSKLGSWTEALSIYENKLTRNPRDYDAMIGCMRCHDASGEWQRVLAIAEDKWFSLTEDTPVTESIEPRTRRKAYRMCAHAAWRLGQWEKLEKYALRLSRPRDEDQSLIANSNAARELQSINVDFDGAFYTAVLHIHRQQWTLAASAIDAARMAMDGRLTALMAESYARAYPSMVTSQSLTELEEIIEFRKVEEKANVELLHSKTRRSDVARSKAKLLSVWRHRLAGCRVDAETRARVLAVRSLVVGPGEEVESTLELSELCRQANRFKFAERVLLDPLQALKVDLQGAASLGLKMDTSIRARVDYTRIPQSDLPRWISKVVSSAPSSFLPEYGKHHEHWVSSITVQAGGMSLLLAQQKLYFAFVRHLWYTERRTEALERLSLLCDAVDVVAHFSSSQSTELCVSCWLELGEWKLDTGHGPTSHIDEALRVDVLTAFRRATSIDDCGYRAWHLWSLLNFRLALQITDGVYQSTAGEQSSATPDMMRQHVTACVRGFIKAISLGNHSQSASVQQDLLNLLTCIFKYASIPGISTVIMDNINSVAIEAWLGVLPQLLARIHIKEPSIRSLLHPLLTKLGEKHPQALMYPLAVLLKSPVAERKGSALSLMNTLRTHSAGLVEEALLVSNELIRVAILWLEIWHEGLEDASRLYFGEGNVQGLLDVLVPLHEDLERGAETRRETDFLKSFGDDLATAHGHLKAYVRIASEGNWKVPGSVEESETVHNRFSYQEANSEMNRAWDIYYTVFRRINKQLPSLTKLDLPKCSPALARAHGLELGVPGSYRIDGSFVKIERFAPTIQTISSKQRPRKVVVRGSDGRDYVFLLKGHEDLRQDERVMQLFGLVNALLVRDPLTRKDDLKIRRYNITPLSQNAGIVGWVPSTDTLHSLIRDYRQKKKIPMNLENKEMLKLAPQYDLLTVMQKVEVFTEALKQTTGQGDDLYEILWQRSTNSEEWLERRTNYTRSLAAMSMVGYILGLGDRHPSNLMLEKSSGRVLHIDFGDCFEVAMNRDKYPEMVPFRLTRMLVKAMEVSGIEGSYRSTCETTMNVLRQNRDSLITMLEAFVYDPLISWRLTEIEPTTQPQTHPEPFDPGAPIDASGQDSSLTTEPTSEIPNDEGGGDLDTLETIPLLSRGPSQPSRTMAPGNGPLSGHDARSRQIYQDIQSMAAHTSGRVASVAGAPASVIAAGGSMARSRIERSMKQRELLSLLDGERSDAHEEALNEKALKVIHRVQDKLCGTDFPDYDGEPLDVNDQVQRLIEQATSTENLSQLFIGWCAFW